MNILILVVICCVIMALALQSLANNILLDSLQPMARQSAKTVEASIHMLADRMMTIAGDPRMDLVTAPAEDGQAARPDQAATRASRTAVLEESAEIYEFYSIANIRMFTVVFLTILLSRLRLTSWTGREAACFPATFLSLLFFNFLGQGRSARWPQATDRTGAHRSPRQMRGEAGG